jgi:hypothetical protein
MNIKGFFTNPVLLPSSTEKVGPKMKMQESAERDADGRRQAPQEEAKRHLSEEEFQSCLKKLEEHPGLLANNLTVKVETKDGVKVILIQDPGGNVVRRLSESQLWSAIQAFDRKTGSILDKAM